MRFYYTNAEQYLAKQKNAARSLGGFLSGSVVPNNSLNNLFGEISIRGRQKGGVEYRCIALKNETGDTIVGAKLWIDQPVAAGVQGDLEVAVTLPSVDNCGRVQYELIENGRTEPYYAEFTRPWQDSAILLPDIKKGETLALWLRRTVKVQASLPQAPEVPTSGPVPVLNAIPGPTSTPPPTDTATFPDLPAVEPVPEDGGEAGEGTGDGENGDGTVEPLPPTPPLAYEDKEKELPIICVEWL